jgi:hypothetical protein
MKDRSFGVPISQTSFTPSTLTTTFVIVHTLLSYLCSLREAFRLQFCMKFSSVVCDRRVPFILSFLI